MSWNEVNKVEQRKQFILRLLKGEQMTDLCQEYEISRTTGYKFLDRFKESGFEGLEDFSRRPHRFPNKTDEFIENLIIDLKKSHIKWGPKKLKILLEDKYSSIHFPAVSTIGMILANNGLVVKSTRRIARCYHRTNLTDSDQANDVWCIDFKGQFRTKDRRYCYPLTISDHKTRYLIACEALESTKQDEAFGVFKSCFIKYGMPKIIRSDNGVPFASSSSIYGLTKLSLWFVKLGIDIERITPGHPEQNGRHERLHKTLKYESICPAANNIMQQQEKFDDFMFKYNNERPHESLGQKTPGSLYRASPVKYAEIDVRRYYSGHDFSRRVNDRGEISINPRMPVKISKIFYGEHLGFKEYGSTYLVSYSKYDIGQIDKNTLKFEPLEQLDG